MISAIVLAKNEEKKIKDCLKSVAWADEILVIDDQSIDKTREIAKKEGARVISHPLEDNFAAQRNYALSLSRGDWVLFVDADERVSSELAEEIKQVVKKNNGIVGYYLPRIDNFMSKWLKYGEIKNIKLLRLAKKNAGVWLREVDEVWRVKGKAESLSRPLKHYPHDNLGEFLKSINERTTLNALAFYEEGKKINALEWGKPLAKFVVNYIFRGGFLDGLNGFVFAVLMSFHSYLVRGKLYLLWKRGKKA
jgi:glycosyltransferase involved in cell wall biosynthesis